MDFGIRLGPQANCSRVSEGLVRGRLRTTAALAVLLPNTIGDLQTGLRREEEEMQMYTE